LFLHIKRDCPCGEARGSKGERRDLDCTTGKKKNNKSKKSKTKPRGVL